MAERIDEQNNDDDLSAGPTQDFLLVEKYQSSKLIEEIVHELLQDEEGTGEGERRTPEIIESAENLNEELQDVREILQHISRFTTLLFKTLMIRTTSNKDTAFCDSAKNDGMMMEDYGHEDKHTSSSDIPGTSKECSLKATEPEMPARSARVSQTKNEKSAQEHPEPICVSDIVGELPDLAKESAEETAKNTEARPKVIALIPPKQQAKEALANGETGQHRSEIVEQSRNQEIANKEATQTQQKESQRYQKIFPTRRRNQKNAKIIPEKVFLSPAKTPAPQSHEKLLKPNEDDEILAPQSQDDKSLESTVNKKSPVHQTTQNDTLVLDENDKSPGPKENDEARSLLAEIAEVNEQQAQEIASPDIEVSLQKALLDETHCAEEDKNMTGALEAMKTKQGSKFSKNLICPDTVVTEDPNSQNEDGTVAQQRSKKEELYDTGKGKKLGEKSEANAPENNSGKLVKPPEKVEFTVDTTSVPQPRDGPDGSNDDNADKKDDAQETAETEVDELNIDTVSSDEEVPSVPNDFSDDTQTTDITTDDESTIIGFSDDSRATIPKESGDTMYCQELEIKQNSPKPLEEPGAGVDRSDQGVSEDQRAPVIAHPTSDVVFIDEPADMDDGDVRAPMREILVHEVSQSRAFVPSHINNDDRAFNDHY